MKKLAVGFVMIISALLAGADETITVGTNSVVVLPKRNVKYAQEWTNSTAYANGDYVKWKKKFYMCWIGGTSSTNYNNGPSNIVNTSLVVDGSVTWYAIPRGNRNGYYLQNIGTTNYVYWYQYGDGSANKGLRINPNGSTITSFGVLNDEHKLIGDTTNVSNNINVGEW